MTGQPDMHECPECGRHNGHDDECVMGLREALDEAMRRVERAEADVQYWKELHTGAVELGVRTEDERDEARDHSKVWESRYRSVSNSLDDAVHEGNKARDKLTAIREWATDRISDLERDGFHRGQQPVGRESEARGELSGLRYILRRFLDTTEEKGDELTRLRSGEAAMKRYIERRGSCLVGANGVFSILTHEDPLAQFVYWDAEDQEEPYPESE